MIGLKRGTVELSDYCEQWPEYYEIEKRRILELIAPLSVKIEHIGSTAIPGIKAKAIIDIAIEVESEKQIESFAPKLQKEGFTYFGDRDGIGDFVFVKGPEQKRTYNIHVSLPSSGRFSTYLIFRDTLRNDPKLARNYQELKEKLSVVYPNDRKEYTKQKTNFIQNVINLNSDKIAEMNG